MKNVLIRLQYRQVIDAMNLQDAVERAISKASYEEFLLKSQAYNLEGKFTKFSEMVANDGRANSLHYKCGFPLGPVIARLKNTIPRLTDNTGQPLRFKNFEHKLIESDINTPFAHQCAINYLTDTLTLVDVLHDYLLLVYGDKTNELRLGLPADNAFMVRLAPGLSVASYQVPREVRLEATMTGALEEKIIIAPGSCLEEASGGNVHRAIAL